MQVKNKYHKTNYSKNFRKTLKQCSIVSRKLKIIGSLTGRKSEIETKCSKKKKNSELSELRKIKESKRITKMKAPLETNVR